MVTTVDKDNADANLAREIMSTVLSLAAFLNEFHPNSIVFLAGVERFVGLLGFIEAALSKERNDLGGFYEKNLALTVIGRGHPRPSARNCKNANIYNGSFPIARVALLRRLISNVLKASILVAYVALEKRLV